MPARVARDKEQLGKLLQRDAEAISEAGMRFGSNPISQALRSAGRIISSGQADEYVKFQQAIGEVARVTVYAMALVDLLARYRVARSAIKQNKDAGYQVRAAWTRQHLYASLNERLPSYLTMPFDEAITSMAQLDPILVKHMNEAYDAYVGRKFWMEKATSDQVLQIAQGELTRTLQAGKTAADFLDVMQEQADDMGDGYLKTVFRTNVLTAQTAGRVKMLADPDLEGFIVALEYSARVGHPSAPRPNHAGMHGWKGAIGHPVWKVWLPPNGFNCRCTVLEITRPEAEEMGRMDAKGRFRSDKTRKWQPDEGFRTSPAAEIYSF